MHLGKKDLLNLPEFQDILTLEMNMYFLENEVKEQKKKKYLSKM